MLTQFQANYTQADNTQQNGCRDGNDGFDHEYHVCVISVGTNIKV
jgi:hypothetical protein